MLGDDGVSDIPAVLGQGVGVIAGAGQVDGEVQPVAELLIGEGLKLRLGPGGDVGQGGGTESQDGVHLLLPLVGDLLVRGVQQVLIVLGAGAVVDRLPVPVAPADHHLVAFEEVSIADIVAPPGGGVVPGGVHVVPLPVHLHQVPGVVAAGIAGDGHAGDAGGVQHGLVGLGVAGTDGGPIQQGTLGLVGDEGHVADVHPVVVVAVGDQVVVEGLDHVVVAHAGGDELAHHPVGLGQGRVGDVAPVAFRHRGDGDGAGGVVHRQGLGDLPVLLIGVQAGDLVGVGPVQVGDLPGQLFRLRGLQVEGTDVDGGFPVQKAGGDGQGGPLLVGEGGLFQLRLGLLRDHAVPQLLPQAVDHVGPGAAGLGGEGQAVGEPLVLGPAHRRGRPVAGGEGVPGGFAQEGEDLVVGQGGVHSEQTVSHAGGDLIFHRPQHGLIVVQGGVGHVGKGGAGGGGFRGARSPPQEGHRLGAGDGGPGREGGVAGAGGDPLIQGPDHRVGVVVALPYVGEAGHRAAGICRRRLGGEGSRQQKHSQQERENVSGEMFHREAPSILYSGS